MMFARKHTGNDESEAANQEGEATKKEAVNKENGEEKGEIVKPQHTGFKFLDPAEQIKVQQLLQNYSKAKGKDAAVQTQAVQE